MKLKSLNKMLNIKNVSISVLIFFIYLNLLPAQSVPYFDGDRDYKHLQTQCGFGPRYPGSEGHGEMIKLFTNFLPPLCDEFKQYKTPVIHPMHGDTVLLSNFLARYNPTVEMRIMLLAHWDTREIADMDTIKENQNTPIIGANDGASGIAVLLTLAELLANNPVDIGIDLLFVDGEDMGVSGVAGSYGLGTKEVSPLLPYPRPTYAICLDMVGDSEQEFLMEYFSIQQASHIVQQVWDIANELGYHQFKRKFGIPIEDDHRVLFNHTGIPAIDIIDFNYPNKDTNYWHTIEDTPDKCSAESLQAVGAVMTELIYLENWRHK